MPGFLVQVGATLNCPHGAKVNITSTNLRVKVGGQPVATMSDLCVVAGCPFQLSTVPPKPQPCVKVQWMAAALRVKVNGQPALLQDSKGICQSAEQIPAGPPIVAMTQTRVRGM